MEVVRYACCTYNRSFLKGGPHENAIAAIAVTMQQATTPEFVDYAKQVVNIPGKK